MGWDAADGASTDDAESALRLTRNKIEDMTETASTHERLLALIDVLAVVRGRVTLASGLEADYYLDLRRVTLEHRAAPLVGDVVLDLLDEHGLLDGEQAVQSIGGLTMGADPVATAVMHRAATRGIPLDAFVVRKAAKQYGMGRRVVGPSVEGRNVVALEDTSTTGGSVLEAVNALREAGAHVVAVVVIVDRDTGAKERVEAEAGVPYLAAISTRDLGLD
jgi:orotate phosphoribosyltransferase